MVATGNLSEATNKMSCQTGMCMTASHDDPNANPGVTERYENPSYGPMRKPLEPPQGRDRFRNPPPCVPIVRRSRMPSP